MSSRTLFTLEDILQWHSVIIGEQRTVRCAICSGEGKNYSWYLNGPVWIASYHRPSDDSNAHPFALTISYCWEESPNMMSGGAIQKVDTECALHA